MSHAAQLTTHAVPPAPVVPHLAQAHEPSDGGFWLFLLTAPISFGLILAAIIYVSATSF